MTHVTIVTTITTVNSGKIDLGHFDLRKISVSEVKRLIEKEANIPANTQRLWWRGYALDENVLPLTRACVGVNEGETIDRNLDSLVLFMTVELPKNDIDFPSSPRPTRLRSYSFDVEMVRAEFKKRETTKCVVS